MNATEQDKQHIIGTYARNNICIKSGKGSTCVDENGKKYIDFGSGIGVNSLGFCNEKWSQAVALQAQTLQHTSNLYYTEPGAALAAKLCEKTGYEKLFLCNSGAEANECSIKIARKYSFDKYQNNRNVILTLVNSFHGRTVTTLSATGQDIFHNFFFPFTEGFMYIPANDIDAFIANLSDKVCGVMIEPIQGEGGVMPLDFVYLSKVAKLCEERDILLIADEVQTGMGRTGKVLACEHFNVKPNIVTLAKGLGGGLPIGAVLTDTVTCNVLTPGTHGTTFGGNPVVCAGATVVVDTVCDDTFLSNVLAKGELIRGCLENLDEVTALSGIGMMIGISLKTKTAEKVQKACLDSGLIVLTAKEKVRLLPPLNITRTELLKGIEILTHALSS